MKRIATLAVILMLSLAASATSVRYFTYSQADRTVRYLYAQDEMMIYCGYDYEIETYVLINDVWMERVNSSYYEIWVYGYDAYTGDEICMPLDLGCIWLFSAGRIYNAAQYLRFHSSARPPHFTWSIPSYNRYVRVRHQPGFVVSYHYDIHRHGWMPPAPGYHPHHPLPPYYMRTPGSTAPRPIGPWTPGVDHPQISSTSTQGRTGSGGRVTTGGSHTQPSSPSASGSSGVRTGTSSSTSSPRQTGGTTTGTSSTRQSTGTSTATSSTRQSTGTSTGTTPTRGNATGSRNTQATQSDSPRTGSSSATSSTGRGSSTNGTTASSSSRGKSATSGTATSSSRGNSSSNGTTASSSSRRTTNSGSTANTSSTRGKTSGTKTGTTTKRGSTSSSGTTTSSNDKAKKGSSTTSSRGTTSSSRTTTSGRTR